MGGGGKGGGRSSGPSAADLARQARGYWQSYSQWMQEAGASREQDIANLRARMGASGSAGSELLQQQIAERERQYEAEVRSIEQGEHGQWLQDYYRRQTRSPLSVLRRVASAGVSSAQESAGSSAGAKGVISGAASAPLQPPSFEEYYTQRFGAAQPAQMSAEERAQQAAAMAGTTRARRPAQPGAGGPTEGSGLIRDQERLTSGWW